VVAAYLILVGILGLGLIRGPCYDNRHHPSEVGVSGGPRLIVIRSGIGVIYLSFERLGDKVRVGGF
jgi:hypothetical protein